MRTRRQSCTEGKDLAGAGMPKDESDFSWRQRKRPESTLRDRSGFYEKNLSKNQSVKIHNFFNVILKYTYLAFLMDFCNF